MRFENRAPRKQPVRPGPPLTGKSTLPLRMRWASPQVTSSCAEGGLRVFDGREEGFHGAVVRPPGRAACSLARRRSKAWRTSREICRSSDPTRRRRACHPDCRPPPCCPIWRSADRSFNFGRRPRRARRPRSSRLSPDRPTASVGCASGAITSSSVSFWLLWINCRLCCVRRLRSIRAKMTRGISLDPSAPASSSNTAANCNSARIRPAG